MTESIIFWAVLITALILGGLFYFGALIVDALNHAEDEETKEDRG